MIRLPYLTHDSASDPYREEELFCRPDEICRIEPAELIPGHTLVYLDRSEKPLLCPLTMYDWGVALGQIEDPPAPGFWRRLWNRLRRRG